MSRGIQVGTTAFDTLSKSIDNTCKLAIDIVAKKHPHLKCVKRMSKQKKIEIFKTDKVMGFAPDGGAWYNSDGTLVAVFEAKKQDMRGNAQERWVKNADFAKWQSQYVKYVTFCSGSGVVPHGPLGRLASQYTIMYPKNFKFHMSEHGFTLDEIVSIMDKTLSLLEI